MVFWLFHLVSTCGYTYAIITPPILWSDIIQQKDGNLWNSAYPVDSTKWFFRIVYVAFCVTTFVTVLGAAFYQNPDHQADYTKSNPVGAIAQVLLPFVTTTVTVGCLWSGITLQRHIVSVGLRGSTQFRILVQLNITMFIIVVTYIVRSLLVLCLYGPMPDSYVRLFHPMRKSFFLWLLWTRWLPCVFCSLCLVHEMRFKGSGSHGGASGPPSATGSDNGRGGGGGEGLQEGLLHKGTRSSSHRPVSTDTTDSALEETYSMLSSVDFPDSASDTSSCVLSPVASPDRPFGSFSSSTGGVASTDRRRTKDIERGDTRGRKRMIQKHLLGAYLPPSSSGGAVGRGAPGPPGLGLESPSSGSDTDFAYSYSGRHSPSRTSVDHFFTFAAPGLNNLSRIAGASADNSSSSFLSAGDGSRSAAIAMPIPAPPAHSIHSTVQQGHGHGHSQGSSRGVMSFSPPTWAGPSPAMASTSTSTPDFINADERASPEVTGKTL